MQLKRSSSPAIPGPADRDALQRRVQRHSPQRLLRQKLVLPGGITVSAEKHNGRLVVRVESPQVER